MGELAHLDVEGGIGTIVLTRPKMNVLNRAMQEQVRECAIEASERTDVKAVIVYGGERVFAAGADVEEFSHWSMQDCIDQGSAMMSAMTQVAQVPKPVIAAITGYALGGGFELALACDFRVAGESAKVGQPEILLGVIPGMGGTQRLSRLVGVSRAKELIFSGRFVDAAEALSYGMVDRVVPDAQVYDNAREWAQTFVAAPSYAVRAAKEAIDRGIETDLQSGLEIERLLFAQMFGTQDRTTGMESFLASGPGKATFEGR